MQTGFKWDMPDYFGLDARAIALFQYFCPTAKLGTGSFYFGAFHDHSGKPLEGGSNYRLHVPANVPVSQFWSITIYSLKTSGFFHVAPHARFARQGVAEERRRVRGHLHWPRAARGSAVQLALHPCRSEVVPVVSCVWPGKGDHGQELEVARHRKSHVRMVLDVAYWPIASFRCCAATRSLSERSGNQGTWRFGQFGRK